MTVDFALMENNQMSNKSDQSSPRLNQVLVSVISPGGAPHLFKIKPISSNSLDLGLGTEAEFFDRSGQQHITGKVVLPMDDEGMLVISTLFSPSSKPIVQKVKQGLRVNRKVSARPRR
jgi:hypothetical protein